MNIGALLYTKPTYYFINSEVRNNAIRYHLFSHAHVTLKSQVNHYHGNTGN